jgi:integrase
MCADLFSRTSEMAKRALSLPQINAIQAEGNHWVAPSLYLQIRPQGTRSWLFRYEKDGRTRWRGLGPAAGIGPVSLTDARYEAERLRVVVRNGGDPIAEKKAKRAITKKEVPDFKWCAAEYVAAHENSWSNPKHAAQWTSTLKMYAEPVAGSLPVDAVGVDEVLRILKPIWTTKPETASRLRGRLEAVLGWAAAKGYRDGANPAQWRGGALEHLLPPQGRVKRIQPRKATPWRDVPALVATLRLMDSVSAAALLFTLLTASRTGEAIGARWTEIDFEAKTWTVPAVRMKAKKEHRVALSDAAIDLLKAQRRTSVFIFPGARRGRPLSNMAMLMLLRDVRPKTGETVHGLRAAFSTWAAEQTDHPHEIVEASLAHLTGNAVSRAYQRGDFLAKRRAVMQDWADYAFGTPNSN